ncbi:GNAT family N-acetyltransferase [Aurantimonas aggregata]|uniref:GNAT family N-acetyltransferase n=1 Tax=Aurantimonas aggregata TaxID=2047720 RepID=UPI001FEBE1B5|nr:GNAT family N-acetyltransferase [Aurantimonas aggregata]
MRGRKIGERLVRQAIEDARREDIAIVPLCPFAEAQIDRHREWQTNGRTCCVGHRPMSVKSVRSHRSWLRLRPRRCPVRRPSRPACRAMIP